MFLSENEELTQKIKYQDLKEDDCFFREFFNNIVKIISSIKFISNQNDITVLKNVLNSFVENLMEAKYEPLEIQKLSS